MRIDPPLVAVLGVGRVVEQPVVLAEQGLVEQTERRLTPAAATHTHSHSDSHSHWSAHRADFGAGRAEVR